MCDWNNFIGEQTMFVKHLRGDEFTVQGYYICQETPIEGQATPCLDVLDGPFFSEDEAKRYMKNNKASLEQAAEEMRRYGPTLEELNKTISAARTVH